MDIKVLGAGCSRCTELDRMTRELVERLGLDATVTYVTDITEVMQYGVMSTPAIVVDGVVKLAGRVPSESELTALLERS